MRRELVTRVVSWNIARRHEAWRQLVRMDADVALLLQEAGRIPADVAGHLDTGPAEYWGSTLGTRIGTRVGSQGCLTGGRWW